MKYSIILSVLTALTCASHYQYSRDRRVFSDGNSFKRENDVSKHQALNFKELYQKEIQQFRARNLNRSGNVSIKEAHHAVGQKRENTPFPNQHSVASKDVVQRDIHHKELNTVGLGHGKENATILHQQNGIQKNIAHRSFRESYHEELNKVRAGQQNEKPTITNHHKDIHGAESSKAVVGNSHPGPLAKAFEKGRNELLGTIVEQTLRHPAIHMFKVVEKTVESLLPKISDDINKVAQSLPQEAFEEESKVLLATTVNGTGGHL